MTQDELKEYISENEPNNILKDELGRWIKREWQTDSGTITEAYEYKHTVEAVNEGNAAWIARGRTGTNPVRDSFTISDYKIELL